MSISKLHLSFFFVFFSISYASSSFSNTRKCSVEQSLALLMFKQNLFSINDRSYAESCQEWLDYDYYPIMMSWNTSIDCCNWDGVTCNPFTGDVIGLDLSCGMLKGTINPNTTLFQLRHLQRLNLAYNDFTDSKFHEIGRFSNSLTHLNISQCRFSGEIPSEMSFLSNLVSLDLSWNGFGVPIQPFVLNNLMQNSSHLRELVITGVNISWDSPTYLNISSSLKILILKYTGLQGKLPDNIFDLRYLEQLDLSENLLTGPLPKVNRSANIPLRWLDLSFTNLSGEALESIGHLKSLNYLDLSFCGLVGSFPSSLVNLRQLISLDLSYNMISGTLPSWLFTLTSLETINLNSNMFSGYLPSELFTHRSLMKISLGNNQFDGEINVTSIPHSFTQLINLTLLDISFNNFTGLWDLDTLLSTLPNLKVLDLSYNGLSVFSNNANRSTKPDFSSLGLASCKLSVFPESLRAMKKLQVLDVSNNDIHGPIPEWAVEIGGNRLTRLNLSYNSITHLPPLNWDGLYVMHLQTNMIQGLFPLSICNMSNLKFLDLSKNSFSGVIPQCMGSITSAAIMVDLANNYFHGTIPNVYEACEDLEGLILKGNQFEGEVPSSLSECQALRILDLGNNNLNGTFPGSLGDLPNLQVLVLKSNYMHGPMETSSALKLPFPSLRVLDLSHNRFSGPLPQKYFQNFNAMKNVEKKGTKPEYLNIGGLHYPIIVGVKGQQLLFQKFLIDYTIVDLSSNHFEGQILNSIGSLNSLIALNLSHNHLNGPIPQALGNLSEIESLDLSWNQLTGKIPESLADITTLAVLNLSQNHLTGRIPQGKQFHTFDASSFGGNSGLFGFPLPKPSEDPTSQEVEGNVDDDEEDGFTWKTVILGYGCGTPLGLALGYLMLSTRRPKWFNTIAVAAEHMMQR